MCETNAGDGVDCAIERCWDAPAVLPAACPLYSYDLIQVPPQLITGDKRAAPGRTQDLQNLKDLFSHYALIARKVRPRGRPDGALFSRQMPQRIAALSCVIFP